MINMFIMLIGYIKNKDVCGVDIYSSHIYRLTDNDINYNHVHDAVSPIFYPFDSENTYSITSYSQIYGPYAVTLYVEKAYYKFWLIKSLAIDIDVMNIIQNVLQKSIEYNEVIFYM